MTVYSSLCSQDKTEKREQNVLTRVDYKQRILKHDTIYFVPPFNFYQHRLNNYHNNTFTLILKYPIYYNKVIILFII